MLVPADRPAASTRLIQAFSQHKLPVGMPALRHDQHTGPTQLLEEVSSNLSGMVYSSSPWGEGVHQKCRAVSLRAALRIAMRATAAASGSQTPLTPERLPLNCLRQAKLMMRPHGHH